MAEMRAKHAFGSLERLDDAIANGVVDAYDILFLKDGDKAVVGWIDKDGNAVIAQSGEECKPEVVVSETLPESGKEQGVIYIETTGKTGSIWDGNAWVKLFENTDSIIDEIKTKLDTKADKATTLEGYGITDAYTKLEADKLNKALLDNLYMFIGQSELGKIKYEVLSTPDNTMVDYRDKEIRVMCPADTAWELQNIEGVEDKNSYYIELRMYSPSNIVTGFKTDMKESVENDVMHSFKDDAMGGTDAYGRDYCKVLLPVAKYDEASQTWTYHGAESTADKFVGWPVSIKWYKEDGKMVDSDCLYLNLTNEQCHTAIDPFYVSDALASANEYTDEQIAKAGGFGGIEIVEF